MTSPNQLYSLTPLLVFSTPTPNPSAMKLLRTSARPPQRCCARLEKGAVVGRPEALSAGRLTLADRSEGPRHRCLRERPVRSIREAQKRFGCGAKSGSRRSLEVRREALAQTWRVEAKARCAVASMLASPPVVPDRS